MGPVARCALRRCHESVEMSGTRAAADRQPRCAPSPTRWAPCSSAPRSRRTSRSAATARPRSSTRGGRMVAQAEHIPVHLGAMPDAVAAVRAPRPGVRTTFGSSTIRSRAARTSPTSRWSPAPVAGYRGHARAPRRRRGDRARQPPRGLASPRRGGRRHPADAPRRRRRSTRSSPGCATRRSAAATSAPSSPRTRSRRARVDELCARRRNATASRPRWTSSRLLGAAGARRDRRASRTGASRRPTCSRRSTAASSRSARVVTIAGDGARDRLRRDGAAARRQPQLPARGRALGLLLRRPLPHRPGRSGLGRRLRARAGTGARGLASSTRRPPAAVAAGNVETSSRIVDVVFAAFGQRRRRAARRARAR